MRGRASRPLFVLVAAALAIGGAGFYALSDFGRVRGPDPATVAQPKGQRAAGTEGAIDMPVAEAVVGPAVTLSGWALDAAGIRAVEIRDGTNRFAATLGIARPDVAQARPGFPDSARAGFEFSGDYSPYRAPPGSDRRELTVVAIANGGRETVLGKRSLIEGAALTRWRDSPGAGAPAFFILPALSGIDQGGALELDSAYAPYVSSTMRAGMRVPILYLRTTRGKDEDFVFDPDWDTARKCGERRIAEDSLNATLAHATKARLPVLITLNGGIWADAACDVPAWDINDHLEADPANCQWNEHDEVMPDDYLKNLPGSEGSPQLGRSLTFNVYAKEVRHYTRRNLVAAARIVASFAREHPDLFVGVSLDPDTYLNPFFGERQWYDYNPGTLRQFRHWLAGTGPYAGAPDARGVPDLSRYRRAHPLTLAEVNRLSGKAWRNWRDVDPPRLFPRDRTAGAQEFWNDAWTREWEVFRRHLVKLHHDELSRWAAEAGLPSARIWSAQGFMAPARDAYPFALRIDGPAKNFDTGGMSVEGALPAAGHLGAILYGASAVNDVRMETPASLFDTFRAFDPAWAAVEYNTADLRDPAAMPAYAAGYRGLRDLFNYGARFVSPMAWNGSNGVNAGKPGYVTFTAWRNTPLEEAARDFLLSHANVPHGARLWTFGSPRHQDGDGWTAEGGAFSLGDGYLTLAPSGGAIALISPRELLLAPGAFDRLVLGLVDPSMLESVRIHARTAPDAPWRQVADARDPSRWRVVTAGVAVPIALPRAKPFDQLKVEMRFRTGAPAPVMQRVAVLPAR